MGPREGLRADLAGREIAQRARRTARAGVARGRILRITGFATSGYFAMFGPARTPPPVIARVQQEVARVVARAEINEKLLSAGLEPAGGTPDALAALLKSEIELWRKVLGRPQGARAEP